jgi:hypothetical protein
MVLMHNARDTDTVRALNPFVEREVKAPFPVHESQLTE